MAFNNAFISIECMTTRSEMTAYTQIPVNSWTIGLVILVWIDLFSLCWTIAKTAETKARRKWSQNKLAHPRYRVGRKKLEELQNLA